MSEEERPRNASATRERILTAAQRVFTDKGYDGAGVREISALAGVNIALVNRYFGSKEGLFRAAILPAVNIDNLLQGQAAGFGQRIADYFASKSHSDDELDPTAAVLRSISSSAVHDLLRDAIDTQVIDQLATWLGGPQAQTRAVLIVVNLLGFDMLRRVIGVEALSASKAQQTRELFAVTLQTLVDGQSPEPMKL